jgi:septum formation protein
MSETPLLLASASAIRLSLLQSAGLAVTAHPARIDEAALRAGLAAEGATPRDMADALAEMKARKLADRFPAALVLGCDQILAQDKRIFAKPDSPDEARQQLQSLRGQTHRLLTALVLYHEARPVWRHIATASLTMRSFSDAYLDAYLARNWPAVRDSVGAYLLEAEGIRLFSAVEGDYFGILGLPLTPLLNYLSLRGFIPS